jgi:hypothetical protein
MNNKVSKLEGGICSAMTDGELLASVLRGYAPTSSFLLLPFMFLNNDEHECVSRI